MNPQRILLIAICIAVIAVPCQSADPKALSVQKFLALKKRFPNLAAVKANVIVEGRLGAYSSKLMRLKNCSVRFVAPIDRDLPIIRKTTRNLEVAGHMTRRNGRYEFVVRTIKSRPADEETLASMQRKLPLDKADRWYALADWSRKRGNFYKDQKLLDGAKQLVIRGFEIERRQLMANDFAGRRKLAGKVKVLNLSPALADELIHETHRLRWTAHRTTGIPNWDALVKGIKNDLAESNRVAKSILKTTRAAYAKRPLITYQQAKSPIRLQLHRLFLMEVLRWKIEQDLKPDGSNGAQIAAEINKQIPELRELAESYREKALAWRFANVETMSRNAVLELVEQFRKRMSPKKATATLKKWLTARTQNVGQARGEEIIQLADDHDRFLGDKKKAVSLLKLASRKLPKSTAIAGRMSRYGFETHRGHWVRKGSIQPAPPDPLETAAANGIVKPGMTKNQVLRAMAVAPNSIVRIAGRGKINEVWIFNRSNKTRMAVHFDRAPKTPRAAARVVNITRARSD